MNSSRPTLRAAFGTLLKAATTCRDFTWSLTSRTRLVASPRLSSMQCGRSSRRSPSSPLERRLRKEIPQQPRCISSSLFAVFGLLLHRFKLSCSAENTRERSSERGLLSGQPARQLLRLCSLCCATRSDVPSAPDVRPRVEISHQRAAGGLC